MMSTIGRDLRGLSAIQVSFLLIIGAVTMQGSLWALDRTPPIDILASEADGFAMAEGTLFVRYTVERHRSCQLKVDRSIITSEQVRIELQDSDWAAAPGPMGRDTYKSEVIVPHRVPPGPSLYRVILQYRCNPLQALYPIIIRNETPFVVAGR